MLGSAGIPVILLYPMANSAIAAAAAPTTAKCASMLSFIALMELRVGVLPFKHMSRELVELPEAVPPSGDLLTMGPFPLRAQVAFRLVTTSVITTPI